MKTTFKHSEQTEAKRFYNAMRGDKGFKALPNCKGFVVTHVDQGSFFNDDVLSDALFQSYLAKGG